VQLRKRQGDGKWEWSLPSQQGGAIAHLAHAPHANDDEHLEEVAPTVLSLNLSLTRTQVPDHESKGRHFILLSIRLISIRLIRGKLIRGKLKVEAAFDHDSWT
jgi:hypothetical protein